MEIKVFQQVEKILKNETKEIREDIQDILEKLKLGIPLGMPHIKRVIGIANGLFEIRVKDRAGQFRVIYFFQCEDVMYLLHAFRKKTRKIPEKEKLVIIKRYAEIINEKVKNL